jgi:hypothetical protein
VASSNGATKLILKPRVLADRLRASERRGQSLTYVHARAFRHLNQFPTFSFTHLLMSAWLIKSLNPNGCK